MQEAFQGTEPLSGRCGFARMSVSVPTELLWQYQGPDFRSCGARCRADLQYGRGRYLRTHADCEKKGTLADGPGLLTL
jgi:hypothetical protein